MRFDVAVLVSVGRHPVSGRPQRADADARALELALRLTQRDALHVIHAGDPADLSLRDYLGMGVPALTVLRQPPGVNVLEPLASYLAQLRLALVLTGTQTEQGEGSGLLPYALARRLGAVLVAAVTGVEVIGTQMDVLQALPRGRRRRLSVTAPCVLTVERSAPVARQSAYARARRGTIEVLDVPAGPAPPPSARVQPARPRPRRLRVATGGSATDRLRALTETQSAGGRQLVHPSPDEAAAAILNYLVTERIVTGLDES